MGLNIDRPKWLDIENESGVSGAISSGIKLCIEHHGPVTSEWVGSAAKRVMSRLRGLAKNQEGPPLNPPAPSALQEDVEESKAMWAQRYEDHVEAAREAKDSGEEKKAMNLYGRATEARQIAEKLDDILQASS